MSWQGVEKALPWVGCTKKFAEIYILMPSALLPGTLITTLSCSRLLTTLWWFVHLFTNPLNLTITQSFTSAG
jgi:hypothetical protein